MIENIIFLLVLFLANTIQTITGFAGNLLAMPPSIILVGVESAKTVLNIFTLLACIWIAWKNREYINKRLLCHMVIFMVLGVGAGVWLFEQVAFDVLLPLYGMLLILIASKKLFIPREIPLPRWCMIGVLFLAGMIHGMFLSGGALLVVYAASVIEDKNEFRATVASMWIVLDAILILNHASLGYYTVTNLSLIAASVLPLIASIKLGNVLYERISQPQFLKITYGLVMLSGIFVIV